MPTPDLTYDPVNIKKLKDKKVENLQKLLRKSERQFAFGHDLLHSDVSGQSRVKPVRLQNRVRE
jgi:hypothetical protein